MTVVFVVVGITFYVFFSLLVWAWTMYDFTHDKWETGYDGTPKLRRGFDITLCSAIGWFLASFIPFTNIGFLIGCIGSELKHRRKGVPFFTPKPREPYIYKPSKCAVLFKAKHKDAS